MKKTIALISLTILMTILLTYVFSKPFRVASALGLNGSDSASTNANSEPLASASELSCANPIPSSVAVCQKMETHILKSTVRFLMYTPLMHVEGFGMRIVNGGGHATVKDGRYLVTHNHIDETIFAMLQAGDPDNLITIDIFNTDGEVILQVPGQALSIRIIENETVVFDFGEKDGVGIFAAHGLLSAQFVPQSSLTLLPGMEVAQIDWDGFSSHIDWVSIEEVTTVSDTSIIKVANCITLGASGGGIFWQGYHIGNNWSRNGTCSQESEPGMARNSSVALNSELVTTLSLDS